MSSSQGCGGCTRRLVLQGFAIGAGTTLLGCTSSDTTPDAPDVTDGAVSMCGSNLCIDVSNPGASGLTSVDGTLNYHIPGDNLVTIRTSQNAFVTVSSVCTHAGCTVHLANTILQCPCHGSQFRLDGTVMRGPAVRPLKSYPTTFDGNKTVTVTL
jgi:Rieske Fe-S protein